MEKEDDMDSLFAGMEFVNPLDAESQPFPDEAVNIPSEIHTGQAQHSKDLYILTPDTKLEGADKAAHLSGIDSILAAYESAGGKVQPSLASWPSLQKQNSEKPGARRKRRTVKIGYGRSAADDTDEGRSATGQDEIGNNGNAFDERNAGLAEVILVAEDGGALDTRLEALSSSVTNKHDRMTSSDVVGVEHKPPYEDLTVCAERIDTADAESLTSEDHSSNVALSALHVNEPDFSLADELMTEKEPQSEEVTTLGKESAEDPSVLSQSENHEQPLCTHKPYNVDHDIEPTTTIHAVNVASQHEIGLPIYIPLDLSLKERLSCINTTVAKNAECIHQKMAIISHSRKKAAQKHRHIAELVSNTSMKLKEVEAEMKAACEREDFEKAEQLDETLMLAQKAKEATMEEFIAVEAEYDKYTSEMHEVMQLLLENDEEGFLLLEQLAQEATEMATCMEKDSKDLARTRTEELSASEAALNLEKEKLMLEVKKVEGKKMELNLIIESSVQEESVEKQRLSEQRSLLLQELDALLAAVRLKETQIADHEMKIGGLEQTISNRVTEFQEERLVLEAKLHELESGLNNLERDLKSCDEGKNNVEIEGIRAQKAAKNLFELSSIAKAEACKLEDALSVRKAAAKVALSSKEKRQSLASQEKQHVEDANSIRDQSSSLRAFLQELASDKAKLQQESISATQQISSIEKRLPEIEAEKRLAAGSRNFKEAGRLAAEAKALLSEMERIVNESKGVTKDLHKLEQELESQARDLTELENQLHQKEKEAAKARYERLRLLAAATRDERDAALELEDIEEAKSLEVEAAAADKEADEIQKEFDFDGMCSE